MQNIQERNKKGIWIFPVVLQRKALHTVLMICLSVVASKAYISNASQCPTSLPFMLNFFRNKMKSLPPLSLMDMTQGSR